MSWTDERIDRLKAMWEKGMTASQIAEDLGGVSRNAVIGKAHRLGLDARTRRYFDLHATLDVKHSEEWNKEAIVPLVSEDPRRATAIAEGALMRLECGRRCFERYRVELRV